MKGLYITISFFFVLHFSVQALNLSPDARISILTCSPGEQVYSIFGHSAIRVYDPQNNIDWVYNYGTFDFDEPGFYPKFIKGQLNYKLSVANYERFEREYVYFKRSVFEQDLNLTQEQKQTLFDLLQTNYLPENRYYLYDFFLDNCATRIRDILEKSTAGNLEFRYDNIEPNLSFRQLLQTYLNESPWVDFGIDILLGAPADKEASPEQYMYLPSFLHDVLAVSVIKDSLENELPLVSDTRFAYQAPEQISTVRWFTPALLFWLLLAVIVGLTFWEYTKKSHFKWLDSIWFTILAIAGTIFVFQWFGSDHKSMANNLNSLFTFPLHFVFAFAVTYTRKSAFVYYYSGFVTYITVILLTSWVFLPQSLHYAMIPVMLSVVLRAGKAYIMQKKLRIASEV